MQTNGCPLQQNHPNARSRYRFTFIQPTIKAVAPAARLTEVGSESNAEIRNLSLLIKNRSIGVFGHQ